MFFFSSSRLRKKLEFSFIRSKLFVDLGNHMDVLEYKDIESHEKGFSAVYKVPIGLHQDHIEKSIPALSVAFDAQIEWHLVGRMLYMMFYTNKIPDSINFHDGLLSQHDFPLWNVGYSRRGLESISFDQVASPMMLFAGATGYGKTTAIKSLVVQMLKQGHEVYLGDPKLDYYVFRNHAHHTTEPGDIIDMVQSAANLVHERQKEIVEGKGYHNGIMEHNRNEEVKLPFVFVIIDEVLDFPTDMEQFWEPMIHIARKGRSAGIFAAFSVQRASSDMFPKVIRNNIALRLCMRMEDESDSKLVLGNESANQLPPIPGRAILRQDRQVECQIPYLSKQQIEAILYAKDSPTT